MDRENAHVHGQEGNTGMTMILFNSSERSIQPPEDTMLRHVSTSPQSCFLLEDIHLQPSLPTPSSLNPILTVNSNSPFRKIFFLYKNFDTHI